MVRFQIGHQIFEPPHQALSLRLHRALQGFGVCPQEVGGGEHVDDLAAEILHPALFARFQMLNILDRLSDGLGVEHVLLLEEVKIWVGVPERVLKAAIKGGVILRRLDLALGQRRLRLDVMFHRSRPIADLMLHYLCRVGHHLCHIGRRRAHE